MIVRKRWSESDKDLLHTTTSLSIACLKTKRNVGSIKRQLARMGYQIVGNHYFKPTEQKELPLETKKASKIDELTSALSLINSAINNKTVFVVMENGILKMYVKVN